MLVTGQAALRSMLIAGGALASLWGAWGLWIFFGQRRIVFRPNRELPVDPSDYGVAFEDVFPQLPNGTRIHGWWIPGDGARKVIICFTGSFGNISNEVATAVFLRRFGANVFIVDYPGFGKSEGRPSEGACYRAASAAWDFAIEQKGIHPEDVMLFGRSMGGCIAAWLAARHRECRRLVIHSAFTSMPDVAARAYPLFPVRYFCYLRFNTLKQLRRCRCPVVVMHSTADAFIPFRHGERILEVAPEPKRLIPLLGDHHSSAWLQTPGLQAALGELLMGERAWA
jgi:pimeloyl-ACP methyl ester carboxylesterase